MSKRKSNIKFVYEKDLDVYYTTAKSKMQVDAKGNKFFYLNDVDDKLEINLYTPNKIYLQQRKQEIQNELNNIEEPSDEELIEEGKMMHPYYEAKEELEHINKDLEKY